MACAGRRIKSFGNLGVLTAGLLVFEVVTVQAQQITGAHGSYFGTVTVDGQVLPSAAGAV